MIGMLTPGNYYANTVNDMANSGYTGDYINCTDPRDQAIFDRFAARYTPITNPDTGLHLAGEYYIDGQRAGMQAVGVNTAKEQWGTDMDWGASSDRLDEIIRNLDISNSCGANRGVLKIMTPEQQQAAAEQTNQNILIYGLAAAAAILLIARKKKR